MSSNNSQDLAVLETQGNVDGIAVGFFDLGRGSSTVSAPTGYTLTETTDTGGTGSSAVVGAGARKTNSASTVSATSFGTGSGATSSTVHFLVVDPGTTVSTIRHYLTATSKGVTSVTGLIPIIAPGDLV